MSAKWADFFVVDSSNPDDPTLKWERLITVGEVEIRSVKDLLNVVSAKCSTNGCKVRRLRISGHANETGASIGADWITIKSLPNYSEDLKKFNSYFDVSETSVTFDQCETGANLPFLTKLSRLWNGVKVSGFFEEQFPNVLWPRDEGLKFTCTLNNCVGTQRGSRLKVHVRIPSRTSPVQ